MTGGNDSGSSDDDGGDGDDIWGGTDDDSSDNSDGFGDSDDRSDDETGADGGAGGAVRSYKPHAAHRSRSQRIAADRSESSRQQNSMFRAG